MTRQDVLDMTRTERRWHIQRLRDEVGQDKV
jgi:hypothetical protein